MTRASVSLEDVGQAVQTLRAQGVPHPGIHRIRRLLGRGSTTTIAKLRDQWQARERAEIEARLTDSKPRPLPNPLARAADDLWREMLAGVDEVEKEAIADAEERIRRADAQATAAAQTCDEQRSLAEARQARIEELEAEIQALTRTLSETRQALAAADTAASGAQERLVEAQRNEQSVRRDWATATQAAANRERELLGRLDAERQRSEEQARQWQQRLDTEQGKAEGLATTLADQRQAHAGNKAASKATIDHLRERAEEMRRVLDQRAAAESELRRQLQERDRRLASLQTENRQLVSTAALLQERLVAAEKDARKARAALLRRERKQAKLRRGGNESGPRERRN